MNNSLGLDKPPAACRVVVAMSGGVDSSAVAAMLKDEGYDVLGLTMRLYDPGKELDECTTRTCCAGRDIQDARRVADALGIPHYVVDYEDTFRRDVIEPFADSYARGETPIPCVSCNQTVKFRDLLETCRDLGGDLLVTGHYVRHRLSPEGAEMWRGSDLKRDQSYFLFPITPEQLSMMRFPLGEMDKTQTRAIAARFNLPVASKPDSQDICFVPDGNYAALVQRLRPEAGEPGDIVHCDGRVLGRHAGIVHYTIGQRRGLGIGGGEPLYVIRLEPETRRVIVGPKEALARHSLVVHTVNWLGAPVAEGSSIRAAVKVRSTREPVPATVWLDDKKGARVELDRPEEGVAPGQACVFYDGERLLGGGWIAREDVLPPIMQTAGE